MLKKLLSALALTLALACTSHAQTPVTVSPPAPDSMLNVCDFPATGNPCTNLATIYSDSALTQVIAQPVLLGPGGSVLFYVTSGSNYIGQLSGASHNSFIIYGGSNGGSCSHALTMDNSGTGAASGATFDCSVAHVLSYNTLGAAPLNSPIFTGTVTLPTTNVPTGTTFTIQSGGTLTCAAGSTCPSGTGTVTDSTGTTSANHLASTTTTTHQIQYDSNTTDDQSGNITAVSYATSNSNGGITGTEGTGAGLTAGVGKDLFYPDSTKHCWHENLNNVDLGCSTTTVASGTSAMGTGAISSGTCATVVTTSATGVATTDTIQYTPNTDPTAVTGYAPSASGSLYIWAYPTSGNVNFKVCNNTSGSITPSALTLNWKVTR